MATTEEMCTPYRVSTIAPNKKCKKMSRSCIQSKISRFKLSFPVSADYDLGRFCYCIAPEWFWCLPS